MAMAMSQPTATGGATRDQPARADINQQVYN
jgi:hypothetical protein